jgi:hypothetical protein
MLGDTRPVAIKQGSEAVGPGIGFISPHAHPQTLERNQLEDWPAMVDSGLTMIQDYTQVIYYESKIMQADRFCRLAARD